MLCVLLIARNGSMDGLCTKWQVAHSILLPLAPKSLSEVGSCRFALPEGISKEIG